MAIIDRWATAIAEVVSTAHGVSASVTDHSLLLGDARETIIRDVLTRFLPANVIIGTGQIVDASGNYSRQIDIVLYRADFPILRTLGRSDVFLLDGVLGAIEVKSTLGKEELTEALTNCHSVKFLRMSVEKDSIDSFAEEEFNKPYLELHPLQQNYLHSHLLPPCYIFGFRGYSTRVKEFSDALREWLGATEGGPLGVADVVCSEGCIALRNVGLPFRVRTADGEWWQVVSSTALQPLRYLIAHLLARLIDSTGRPTHAQTGVRYAPEGYLDYADLLQGDWQGVFGRVVSKDDALPPTGSKPKRDAGQLEPGS